MPCTVREPLAHPPVHPLPGPSARRSLLCCPRVRALLASLLIALPTAAGAAAPPAAPAAPTTFITFGTGSTAGLYYPTAESLARIVNDAHIGLRIGARATGGAVFNVQAIQQGAMQMAITQNNIAYFAYRGTGIPVFEGKPTRELRGLATLYPEVVHLLVRKDSGIRSPADLKGKVVDVGAIGSGPEQDAIAVLGVYGLKLSDLKSAVRTNSGDAVNLLRDGKIDAMFYTVGLGSAAIQEAMQTAPVTVLPLDREHIERLIAERPYYTSAQIPAGAYPHVDQALPTVAVEALLVASSRLPEEQVRKFMDVLFQQKLQQFLQDTPNPNLRSSFRLDRALLAMPLPLHPGAAAFYRSVGVDMSKVPVAD